MSVAGTSGTHRAYNNEDAKTVIAEARRMTAAMMLNSRESSQVRARDFVKLHPRQQFLAQSTNETPRIDAWSLLRNIEQDKAALAWSQDNQPLIYGVEVVGSINNIKKLVSDPIVKGFEPGVKVNGRIIIPRSSLREQVVTSQDLGVRSQAIPQTAEEIYTRIENIARYGIK
ncbi:hypothetical protein [Chroogloeocystis siderophila]|jgi:hypothetical protein|uniref:Uncharacterized protein n=1 Tax=Chroogloeocystis siderophila 5.2 s.c.1 TaxID=247279 RepID=A0A1U7HY75_9CHRO|nr:hypothetical protein [Chroogloeocystis siderophila]OKH28499.1 hypothetical protein NIES1031_04495 [Chroogloeocystis siderophila 5.2 s.c.1]